MEKFFMMLKEKSVLVAILGAIAGSVTTFLIAKFGKAITALLKGLWYFLTGQHKNRQFEKKYLDWLVQEHQFLGLIPTSKVVPDEKGYRKTDLERVYTTLRLADADGLVVGKEQESSKINGKMYSRRRLLKRKKNIPEEEQLGWLVEKEDKLLIKGDPGSGKTTLLRYLAISCARAWRAEKKKGDDKRILKKRLGWSRKRFPILLSLIHLQGWNPDEPLLEAFKESLPIEIRDQLPDGYFERKLKRGQCLILLDGFDELGNELSRDVIADRVGGLWNDFKDRGNKIIVTSRIVGYEEQLVPYDFVTVKVKDLDNIARSHLIRQRFRAIALNEAQGETPKTKQGIEKDYQERAQALLDDVQGNDHLERLTHNPLLLTLIVMIAAADIEIPAQRHELYQECVDVLADRWGRTKLRKLGRHRKGVKEKLVDLSDKKKMLSKLAFEMQLKRDDINQQSLYPRKKVEKLFSDQLKNEIKIPVPDENIRTDKYHDDLAHLLLDDIQEKHGILVEKGYSRELHDALIAFSHLSFQEYLAAFNVIEQQKYSTVVKYLTHPAWAEVVKLYRAMSGKDEIIRAMLNPVAQQPEGLLLAASCSAEYSRGISENLAKQINEELRRKIRNESGKVDVLFIQAVAQLGGRDNIDLLFGLLDSDERLVEPVLQILGESPFVARDKKYAAHKLLQLLGANQMGLKTRIALGLALDHLGDPRFSALEPEMTTIPGGAFKYGDNKKEKKTAAFEIAKYPVTNSQYKKFVDETGHKAPKYWKDGFYPEGEGNHPVAGVNWYDANAYCDWLNRKTGSKKNYRLPNEIEWEKAARGKEGREYPWGDEFDKQKCNGFHIVGGTSAAGIFPEGRSPFGVMDCAGNVWEWTSSFWEKQTLWKLFRREKKVSVIRGGSWDYNYEEYFRCATRGDCYPVSRDYIIGFRVARSAQS